MNIKQEQGFSILAVVLVVAVVIAAGLIVWRVLDSNKAGSNRQATNAQSQQEQTGQPAADPNEGYVVIREWGVRFRVVEELSGVEYFSPDSEYATRFSFTTSELASKEPRCAKDGGMMPLGLLSRTREAPHPGDGGVIAEIDGYTYQFRSTDAACSEDEANIALESRTGILLNQSVKTLEAAQ